MFGGRDGLNDRRAGAQIVLIDELEPNVVLMQEAKSFEADGDALLLALEARIRMRGFLAVKRPSGRPGARAGARDNRRRCPLTEQS